MTHLSELFDITLFSQMVDEKYVRIQSHPTEPLWIANYAEKAVYEKAWNDVTLRCRGLIFDAYDNVVARPWPKFFNLGEHGNDLANLQHTTRVEVTDKCDGSLGILYRVGNSLAIATRGSFASDQATKGTEILRTKHAGFWPTEGVTYLFEIIYPENRIVLDYGTTEELVLLGGVLMDSGYTVGPNDPPLANWAGPRTTVFSGTLSGAVERAPRPNAEGVVVRFLDTDLMVKIKQDDYVILHKLITGLSQRSVWEALGQGQTLAEVCAPLPDEFHDWVRGVYADLVAGLLYLEDVTRAEFEKINSLLGIEAGRPAFAKLACVSPFRSWLFLLYDGKHQTLKDSMWQTLKPSAESRWGNSGD